MDDLFETGTAEPPRHKGHPYSQWACIVYDGTAGLELDICWRLLITWLLYMTRAVQGGGNVENYCSTRWRAR